MLWNFCLQKLSSLIQRHIEGNGILVGVEKDRPSILKTYLLLGRIMLIKSPVSSFKTTWSYTQCSKFICVSFGIGGGVGLLPVMFLFFLH